MALLFVDLAKCGGTVQDDKEKRNVQIEVIVSSFAPPPRSALAVVCFGMSLFSCVCCCLDESLHSYKRAKEKINDFVVFSCGGTGHVRSSVAAKEMDRR
jgi:hypothetical protein